MTSGQQSDTNYGKGTLRGTPANGSDVMKKGARPLGPRTPAIYICEGRRRFLGLAAGPTDLPVCASRVSGIDVSSAVTGSLGRRALPAGPKRERGRRGEGSPGLSPLAGPVATRVRLPWGLTRSPGASRLQSTSDKLSPAAYYGREVRRDIPSGGTHDQLPWGKAPPHRVETDVQSWHGRRGSEWNRH